MMKRKGLSCLFSIFIILFVITLGMIAFWFGVPVLSEKAFGKCAQGLTELQCRLYGSRILTTKSTLTGSNPELSGETVLVVDEGDSIAEIAGNLEQLGLVSDRDAFINYLIYSGLDSQIRAGTYSLRLSLSPLGIAEEIRANKTMVSFYIYPGWRAEEIAAALPSSGIEVDPEDFLEIVRHPARLPAPSIVTNYPSVEGFLFPGEYLIPRKITADELVLTLVRGFEEAIPQELEDQMRLNGLDLYQGVILASIIQRESYQAEERPRIASVFYNRLAAGMRLETDPTVQYALGVSTKWDGWWKTPLRLGDLDINSPYNTYLVYGLPPTPISNPDLSALLAAAYPESTNYFYFRSACDNSGFHLFSETYEEHLLKACE
jgi:UPF0755 protein